MADHPPTAAQTLAFRFHQQYRHWDPLLLGPRTFVHDREYRNDWVLDFSSFFLSFEADRVGFYHYEDLWMVETEYADPELDAKLAALIDYIQSHRTPAEAMARHYYEKYTHHTARITDPDSPCAMNDSAWVVGFEAGCVLFGERATAAFHRGDQEWAIRLEYSDPQFFDKLDAFLAKAVGPPLRNVAAPGLPAAANRVQRQAGISSALSQFSRTSMR